MGLSIRAHGSCPVQAGAAGIRGGLQDGSLADIRLHDLRRTLATRLAGAGLNSYILRDVLGHKTLAMSNRYVRAAGAALAEAVEKGAALTAEAMGGRHE